MDRRASEWERQRAKEIAAAVLDGRTTVLEAVRELYPLAHTDAIVDEEDRTIVIAIESETDDLPIGEVRKLWAPHALEAKDAEIARPRSFTKRNFLKLAKGLRSDQIQSMSEIEIFQQLQPMFGNLDSHFRIRK